MQEIRRVVTEIKHFECRGESIMIPPFSFWDSRVSDANNILNEFSKERKLFSPSVVSLIQSMMKDIKPVVTEKNKHEHRHVSLPIALSRFFRLD